jgi:putative transposase
MQYRRAREKGGTYFFTVNLADRRSSLLVDKVDLLRNVINRVMARHPFTIDAMVVLPEHLHSLWTLPSEDEDFSTRWMLIKQSFSRQVVKKEPCPASRTKKGERGIWQRRFWEYCIRNDRDYSRHVEYIHYNPVKHGYVQRASDWQFSSINRYIASGIVEQDWGIGPDATLGKDYGERIDILI